MIKVTFLGTTAMMPTIERNQVATFVKFKGEGLLFDCGEGTQRQLRMAKISPTEITKIFISHWHGDHVLGLSGLMQTMGMSSYPGVLEIYGPKGTKKKIDALGKVFDGDNHLQYKIFEVEKGKIAEEKDFFVEVGPMQHPIVCNGYRFQERDFRNINMHKATKLGIAPGPSIGKLQEGKSITVKGKKIKPDMVSSIRKGKSIAIILDTKPCNAAKKLAKEVDLLVCEATFAHVLEDKGDAYGHMTARQAAQLASESNAAQLVLTHLSQRYKDPTIVLNEAKDIFPETRLAHDLMKISI